MDYHRERKLKTKIIRIFNTYGPNMAINDGRVVSNFIIQALNNENITVYGNGHQTRSFQYVDDLVEGMVRMMSTEDSFTGPVNLGNPDEFTMLELAQHIIRLTVPVRKSFSVLCLPTIPNNGSRTLRLQGKAPRVDASVSLDEGLRKTISYFQNL